MMAKSSPWLKKHSNDAPTTPDGAKKRATPRNGSAGAETEPVIIVRKPKKLIRPP
jgi:hypothetical protein